MNKTTLSKIDLVYQNSKNCRINFYPVAHQQFRDFCIGLSQLDRCIKTEYLDDNESWQDFLLILKRYRFELCSTPIPFNSPEIVEKININNLKQQLRRFKRIYPEKIFCLTEQVFNQFYTLTQLSDNPLLDYIENNLYNSNYQSISTPVLLQHSRQIPLVNNYQLSNLELLIPSKLRDCECYEKLTVIGCSRWFPEYTFIAPRAKEINLVHYDWFMDKWKAKQVFVCSQNFESKKNQTNDNQLPVFSSINKLEPEEILLPKIDLNQVAKHYGCSSESVDEIEAYLFALEGDNAVFLEKDSKIFIIDTSEEDDSIVSKKTVAEIERDMFILLRTQGGGDYIKETADKILYQSGENHIKLRKLQKEWKLYLKNMINRTNLYSVCVRLAREGCKLANSEINIRNCISENYIKPRNEDDFRIILEVIGLGDRFDEFYDAACLISQAHHKAGHHLGKLLRQNIENYDLNELEQRGIMKFTLDEEDSGSLTAFQVLDIRKETVSVSFYQHGKLFEI